MALLSETVHAISDDGVRLALHVRPAPKATAAPVICCHGLASNATAFDLDPDASLARFLNDAGHDVYLLELRGGGRSERPSGAWSFDTYLDHDLPAAVSTVAQRSGGQAVHFVGHSMGGLLGLAALARGVGPIASVVTVGSSLDYSGGTGFRAFLPLRPLLMRLPSVPVGAFARASASLVGRWSSPYERFNVWPSNVEPSRWKRICEEGFHPVPSALMVQLASALEPGGLRPNGGGEPYLAHLERVDTPPVLMIGGDRDAQCPPEAVRRTCDAIGDGASHRILGPEAGCEDHYGHFDLLVGHRVRDEVFPHIARFLAGRG